MQLKCPDCLRTLKIPETAVGKVVKCPCGKQLRVPNPAAGTPAGPASRGEQVGPTRSLADSPVAPQSASHPTTGALARSVPARRQPVAADTSSFGIDADLFDELTEADLRPMAMAAQPGRSRDGGADAKLSSVAAQMDKDATAQKQRDKSGSAKDVYSSIGILFLLGLLKLSFNIVFLMGLDAAIDAMAAIPNFEGDLTTIATFLRVIYICNIVIGIIFCVCGGLIFMFPMTCSITALVIFIIGEILSLILNPFLLISVRMWIVRAAFFGGLVQCVNNAAYFKFVKAGGRN